MSFDRDHLAPNHATHVPVKVALPADDDLSVERPRLPTPHLFQEGVVVKSRDGKREGIVRCVDHLTNQFRLVEKMPDGSMKNHPRVSWESFANWIPEVRLSAEEQERRAAREKLLVELATLDKDSLAAVEVFADDADPAKALAKIEALRRLGVIKAPTSVPNEAIATDIQDRMRAEQQAKGGGKTR